jgi:LmbE family N-acetylglucosaminyl deacetylase
MQITDAAVFYSRLTKWDDHFDHLPVHAISAQLYFKLAFEPLSLTTGATHFVGDITDTLEQKIASVKCYATQFPPEKEYVFDRIRGAALQAGSTAGCQAGETFQLTRALRSSDLMQTIFP